MIDLSIILGETMVLVVNTRISPNQDKLSSVGMTMKFVTPSILEWHLLRHLTDSRYFSVPSQMAEVAYEQPQAWNGSSKMPKISIQG